MISRESTEDTGIGQSLSPLLQEAKMSQEAAESKEAKTSQVAMTSPVAKRSPGSKMSLDSQVTMTTKLSDISPDTTRTSKAEKEVSMIRDDINATFSDISIISMEEIELVPKITAPTPKGEQVVRPKGKRVVEPKGKRVVQSKGKKAVKLKGEQVVEPKGKLDVEEEMKKSSTGDGFLDKVKKHDYNKTLSEVGEETG